MAEITTTTPSSSSAPASDPAPSGGSSRLCTPALPRVTIRFCTQCKWMLRAAYYAQELLSTFSTGLGEVALQPSTGGTFIIEILAAVDPSSTTTTTGGGGIATQQRVLWDRTIDGGFPETKELKRRVRDVIEPTRDLGHVDRDHSRKSSKPATAAAAAAAAAASSAPASSDAAAPAPAAPVPHESILTSSSSSTSPSNHPTIVRDTPRQGQSHPRMPAEAAAAGPPANNVDPQQAGSTAASGTVDEKGTVDKGVCEDCQ